MNTKTVEQIEQAPVTQLEKAQNEVEDLKDIMRENIEKILNRGLNLDNLNKSCENLELQAGQFKLTTKKVKRKYFFKNKKILFFIILFLIVLVLLILVGVLLFYFLFLKNKSIF